MSTGVMRATARDLRRRATSAPLAVAAGGGPDGRLEQSYFAKIDRELSWGLTLNK